MELKITHGLILFGGGGGKGCPPPTVGSFFIFRLENVQSGAYLRRKFRLDMYYMGKLVWN